MRQAASGRHGRPQQRQRCCTPAAWSTGSPSAVPPLHAPCRCLSWAWPWTLSSCGWVRCAAPRYAALCRCGRLWGHVLGRWAGCACGAVNTGPLLPPPAFPPPPKTACSHTLHLYIFRAGGDAAASLPGHSGAAAGGGAHVALRLLRQPRAAPPHHAAPRRWGSQGAGLCQRLRQLGAQPTHEEGLCWLASN